MIDKSWASVGRSACGPADGYSAHSICQLIGHRGKFFQLCFLDYLEISPVEKQQGDLCGSLFCLSRAFTKHNTRCLWSDHHTETISALIIGKGYRFKRRDIRELTETLPSLSYALYYINRTASQSIRLASHSTTSILLVVLCNRFRKIATRERSWCNTESLITHSLFVILPTIRCCSPRAGCNSLSRLD
jgi:hypothetical protein